MGKQRNLFCGLAPTDIMHGYNCLVIILNRNLGDGTYLVFNSAVTLENEFYSWNPETDDLIYGGGIRDFQS